MQGKGVVKFFLVVMAIVTLVQYLFILPTNRVEKKADDLATAASVDAPEEQQKEVYKQVRAAYLDSMSSEEILKLPLLKNYTYQELKGQQLALGLDLKGGMSVVLQVDLREFIRTLSNNNEDPTLEEALDAASEAQKNAQSDYVTLFANEFRKNEEGKKLAPIFARNEALREEINFDTPDGEVVRVLRQKANETVQLTFQLLKERIDKLGVVQPNVSLDASRDLILVELPGIDNPERARNFLQAAAKLEFWNVYRITDPVNPAAQGGTTIMQALAEANQTLSETMGNGDLENQMVYDTIYAKDTLGNDILTEIERIDTTELPFNLNSGPLFDLMQPNTQGLNGLAVMGLTERNRRDRIDTLLARPEVQNLFPRDLEWHWSADPVKNFETGEITNNYELYAIKKDDAEAPLSGDHVTGANADSDPMTNQMVVSLRMDNTGAKIWGQMTTQAAQNNNREIAILLDGEVVSAPRVNEPILGGSSSISGSFSLQEAEDLATILEIGKLPATTRIIQQQTVGPTLGQQNINKSVRALVVGFLLVLGFMILYYGGAGIIAIVALFLNLFFIFGALASLGTVLTLPGIAGIVLTIGMAVDANVIIFERIREELREGKSTLMAISDGFKNSYSAIIDANVTTILTAMVLAYFGLGPIKGFAVVLIIGVLSSLFTAVLVGRLMFDWWTSKGRKISFNTGFSKNAFANLNIDWLGKRKMAYVISGVLLTASIGSFLVRGFELGVDFKGGYSYNVTFADSTDVQAAELREALTASFEESVPVVKAVDTDNTFNVVTDYQVDNTDENASDLVMAALFEGVSNVVGGENTLDNFSDADGEGTHVTSSSKVGPTIADDIKQSAVYAAIFALLLIFLYIFIRFSKWQYSLGAVAALFHDSIIVLGLFSVFHGVLPINLEIDQAFIAAILTVIGYSINDTVVVFDRIREFMNAYTKKSKEEVINMAINSTVSRTVITSLTTLLVVAILFVFGGTSIKGFALALLIGIIVGTYSSIFVATPVMSDLSGDLKAKPSKGANTGKGFSKAMEKAR